MDAERIWREKPDEEVVEAAERLSEFTAEGERIIRAELRRRGLSDPPAPIDYCWKCGRGICAGGPDDACGHCGERFVEAVRRRLGAVAEPLVTEVVYRSRFAHEVTLVTAQLEEAGIGATQGTGGVFGEMPMRYLGIPVLDGSEFSVAVAAADAAQAREIIESLPVSHEGGEEVLPAAPDAPDLPDSTDVEDAPDD